MYLPLAATTIVCSVVGTAVCTFQRLIRSHTVASSRVTTVELSVPEPPDSSCTAMALGNLACLYRRTKTAHTGDNTYLALHVPSWHRHYEVWSKRHFLSSVDGANGVGAPTLLECRALPVHRASFCPDCSRGASSSGRGRSKCERTHPAFPQWNVKR